MEFGRRKTALESSSPGLLELLVTEHESKKRAMLELCGSGNNSIQRKKRFQRSFFRFLVTKENLQKNQAQGRQYLSSPEPNFLRKGSEECLDKEIDSVLWREHLLPSVRAGFCTMGESSTLMSSQEHTHRSHHDQGQGRQGQCEGEGEGQCQRQSESEDQGHRQGQGEDQGKGQAQGHWKDPGQSQGLWKEQDKGEREYQEPGSSLLHCVPVSKALNTSTTTSCMADGIPEWKNLLTKAQGRDKVIGNIESKIQSEEQLLRAYQETRAALENFTIKDKPFKDKEKAEEKEKEKEEKEKEEEKEREAIAFTPLTEEEEERVTRALNESNRHVVLVQHERSNIDLTTTAIRCLKPGAWLNDDVINLYLELLKERELREPKAFMKCHFFNTFFYNKLYKDARSYNYKAVRRWTTVNKLGYNLLECDKIFVPIHKDVHWCLGVINVREKKLQYLDSLKGHDTNVLHMLMRYLKDEAKDKLNEELDSSGWELDCPTDIPEQLNGETWDISGEGQCLNFSN